MQVLSILSRERVAQRSGIRIVKGLFGMTGNSQRSSRMVNRRTPASAMQEITLRDGHDWLFCHGSDPA
jgi:hypothetical protein